MRYVRLNNNTVAEVGHFDSIEGRFHPSLIWLASDVAEIGDLWDGATFTPAPPAPTPIPAEVTMRQARLALLAAGLLDTVETAIMAAGPAAKIEWEYAQEVQRASGLVPAMAIALGMTEAQIDTLFVTAAAL